MRASSLETYKHLNQINKEKTKMSKSLYIVVIPRKNNIKNVLIRYYRRIYIY